MKFIKNLALIYGSYFIKMAKRPNIVTIVKEFDTGFPISGGNVIVRYEKRTPRGEGSKEQVDFNYNEEDHQYFRSDQQIIKLRGLTIVDKMFLNVLDKTLPAYVKKLIKELNW